VVVSFKPLNHIIRFTLNRYFFLFITRVEITLNDFNNKLNRTIEYEDLLTEYYKLFEKIFHDEVWAIYIYHNDRFRLQKYALLKNKSQLPSDISYLELPDNHIFIKFKKRWKKYLESQNFDIAPFLNHTFDTLIPIPGKSQFIALIFTNSRNITFLYDKSIEQLAARILRKSGQILENTILYREVTQKSTQIRKLMDVTQKIISSLDSEKILDFLLEALYDLIPFDAGVIFLLDPDSKKLYRKVSQGYDDSVDLTLKLGQGTCGWVAQNKKTSLLSNVHKSKYYYPARKETLSQIVLPLKIQDEVIGVLCLESNEIGYFTKQSKDLLNLFANNAAIALNNAKQYEISLAKKSLEHELINAGRIQKILLPERPPVIKNLNISFSHIASKIVSGDVIDLIPIDQNTLGLMIGDVSGKGAQAAIMMSLLLAGFRAYIKTYINACEVVARLNNLLYESISEGNFATFFYALISTAVNTITYSNAGHNPPILIKDNGDVEMLAGGGMVLGFLQNETYIQKSIAFAKGDTLVCFTDGITEALNLDGVEFGEERLLQLLKKKRHLNSYDLKQSILEEIRRFTQREDFNDDLTIGIVKYY